MHALASHEEACRIIRPTLFLTNPTSHPPALSHVTPIPHDLGISSETGFYLWSLKMENVAGRPPPLRESLWRAKIIKRGEGGVVDKGLFMHGFRYRFMQGKGVKDVMYR